jgi:hypothetical protein
MTLTPATLQRQIRRYVYQTPWQHLGTTARLLSA